MSALRRIALCCVVSVAAFLLAASLAGHPEVVAAIDGLSGLVDTAVWQPAVSYAWHVDAVLLGQDTQSDARVVLALRPPDAPDVQDLRSSAHYNLPTIIRPRLVDQPRAAPQFAAVASDIIMPDLPAMLPVREAVAPAHQTAMRSQLSPEQARARARLIASLSPEMRANFDLFLYVSKAKEGPLAQRMYVFEKRATELALRYDWAASTGREKEEISPRGTRAMTATPRGYYELDPDRLYAHYRSYSWEQPMPYAMFFNWQREGLQTGLAIHAATGRDIARLGRRASAGCVHLAPDNARTLFNLIRDHYQGDVPRLAYDARTDSLSNGGRFAHDAQGHLKMAAGYKVLIFIEDYGGDEVAALF